MKTNKKLLLLFYFLVNNFNVFSQDLITNKAETIALLNNHFSKTNGLIIKDTEGDYTLKDCKISYERGLLTIVQTVYRNNSDYWKNIYQFSPLYIEGVNDNSNDYKREKEDLVGSIIIYNPKLKVSWQKLLPDNKKETFWHNSWISIHTYYDGEKDANNIKKGLLRLQKLLKDQTDPFELTADERKLSNIFAKYKSCETRERPTGNFKGAKIKVDDMLFSLKGPFASYHRKSSRTTFYDDDGGISDTENTQTYIVDNELWWRNINYLRYNVVAGSLVIQSKDYDIIGNLNDISSGKVLNKPTNNMIIYFKPASADAMGEVKRDVLEIISLIKNTVKLYGGGEVKVDINEI